MESSMVVNNLTDLYRMKTVYMDSFTFSCMGVRPMPAPRARSNKYGKPYTPPKYVAYKENLKDSIDRFLQETGLRFPERKWIFIWGRFYFPYPKATRKMDRIESKIVGPMPSGKHDSVAGDEDNYLKGVQDALVQGGFMKDDIRISDGEATKLRTVYNPRILVTLYAWKLV
jgi:Holliday junction resolvase RusA-like endonuclease